MRDARAIVVAPRRDDAAVLITLTARELNASATIVAAVREEENAAPPAPERRRLRHHLVGRRGADARPGTLDPARCRCSRTCCPPGAGLDIIEREVAPDAVGGPPGAGPRRLVVAVVRGGEVLRFDDPRAQTTQPGDRAR